MVGFYPIAIGASICGVLALLFFAIGGNFGNAMKRLGRGYQERIERADMSIKAEEYALIVTGAGAIVWVAIVLVLRPDFLVSILIFPASMGTAIFCGSIFAKIRGDMRLRNFGNQLELVLRMLAGALRVGLGLRQAIILVTEEVQDPARREFMRVIGRTNIGIGIIDALEELAKNMPSSEMNMFARAIRVQSQTGGDLARVLETLGGTIRDRRRVVRKMGALTAQGRFGALIIGGLPIIVGTFVIATQADMAHALLHTKPGWIALGAVFVLEALAAVTLNRILQFDA
jgi:tight adherence protein B